MTAKEESNESPVGGGGLRPITVLVVDDSPTMRVLLASIFDEASGIELIGEAKDGKQAVVMAKKFNPDVITMDVIMPAMNGLEATKQIMDMRPTPIIIVTSTVNEPGSDIVFEAMKVGALEIIAKPDNLEGEVAEAWREVLVAKVRALAGAFSRAGEK